MPAAQWPNTVKEYEMKSLRVEPKEKIWCRSTDPTTLHAHLCWHRIQHSRDEKTSLTMYIICLNVNNNLRKVSQIPKAANYPKYI